MELKITQKTFNAAPISALLREGEKAADTLVFVAPKQYGGLILGALRQALRDVPEQEGFPYAVHWPVPPAE